MADIRELGLLGHCDAHANVNLWLEVISVGRSDVHPDGWLSQQVRKPVLDSLRADIVAGLDRNGLLLLSLDGAHEHAQHAQSLHDSRHI